jgi:FkbM family methyltransferase
LSLLTELYRRFVLFRHKPRHWRLRPGTIDRRLFREVVIHNDYDLPPRFDPTDVIVDVGGHIGSFTYAVLKRGAGTVYCCEADADNFRLLRHNLRPYGDRVRLLPWAVWRSDQRVTHLRLRTPEDPRNTGAIQVTTAGSGAAVPVLPFDELVLRAAAGGAGRIRLLKLDCEGAEWPILLTARRLDLVDAICGEYHLDACTGLFAVRGYSDYTPALLERHLAEHGFRVRSRPAAKDPRFGLFFAERQALPFRASRSPAA